MILYGVLDVVINPEMIVDRLIVIKITLIMPGMRCILFSVTFCDALLLFNKMFLRDDRREERREPEQRHEERHEPERRDQNESSSHREDDKGKEPQRDRYEEQRTGSRDNYRDYGGNDREYDRENYSYGRNDRGYGDSGIVSQCCLNIPFLSMENQLGFLFCLLATISDDIFDSFSYQHIVLTSFSFFLWIQNAVLPYISKGISLFSKQIFLAEKSALDLVLASKI